MRTFYWLLACFCCFVAGVQFAVYLIKHGMPGWMLDLLDWRRPRARKAEATRQKRVRDGWQDGSRIPE